MSSDVYLYLSSLASNLVSDFLYGCPICGLFKLQWQAMFLVMPVLGIFAGYFLVFFWKW